jgi:hypothetical protein
MHNNHFFTHLPWISKNIFKIIIFVCEVLTLVFIDVHIIVGPMIHRANDYVYEQSMII